MSITTTPGVYVQEVATLPASVAQVATAIPAFMGYTENSVSDPTRITSLAEFVQVFGGPSKDVVITLATTTDSPLSSVTNETLVYRLYYAIQLYFQNGGGPCYVVSTGQYSYDTNGGEVDKTDFLAASTGSALSKLLKEDEPTLLVPVDAYGLSDGDYYEVIDDCLAVCNTMKDRFTVLDAKGGKDGLRHASNGVGMNYLKYGAAYYPELATTISYPDSATKFTGGNVASGVSAAVLGKTLEEVQTLADGESGASTPISDMMTTNQKGIRDGIKALGTLTLPASAAIAGIYAAVDRDRGVWKAPANVSISGGSAAEDLTDAEQGDYNVDTTAGKSINVIRNFSGRGTLVWGARTLAGNDNEWRYVPVRRLFITIEESIAKATQFVVFEPNDANTWTRTKAMIENYLTGLWRQGALAGPTPAQAFFVNVGLGETMTADDILNGNLIIEIGIAAVRPAEFIILKFSHKLQEA